MTRDEKDRLTKVEVRLDNLGVIMVDVAKDVRAVRDAMLQSQGAEHVRSRMSTIMLAIVAAAASLFGGGIGAVILKKFG